MITETDTALANNPAPADEQPPTMGEQTGKQTGGGDDNGLGAIAGLGVSGSVPGWGRVPPASIKTYRRMVENPIVAIGRMAVHAPIKAANWSVETDDDAPDGAADLVDKHIAKAQPLIVSHALQMLDFGHKPFEIVWTDEGGATVPRKFKSLLPEKTSILCDKETGAFAGLKQGKTTLMPSESLLFTFDPKTSDDYKGRSLLENIRETAWWPWEKTLHREGQQSTKISGSQIVCKYPPGKSKDASGAEQDNFEIARQALTTLTHGKGICIPLVYQQWAETAIARGADPSKLVKWMFEFLEPGTGYVPELIDGMKHKEALILNGIMVPERTVKEGKFGTKAESATQAEFVFVFAAGVLAEIIRCVNWYVVDRVLALNYGPESRGTVRVVAEPIIDSKIAVIREVITKILTDGANFDVVASRTDIDAQLELLGFPLIEREEDADGDPLRQMVDRLRVEATGGDDPAQPAPTPGGPDAPGVATKQALNGAQITAALNVLERLAAGSITGQQATALLVSMGVDEERAGRIIGTRRLSNPKIKLANEYAVPAGVRAEAQKALAWRAKHKRGGTRVGMSSARTLAEGGQVSAEFVRKVARYFPRHEVDKQADGFKPGEDGYPSNGRIAWSLWGGDAGRRWAATIVKRLDKAG